MCIDTVNAAAYLEEDTFVQESWKLFSTNCQGLQAMSAWYLKYWNMFHGVFL